MFMAIASCGSTGVFDKYGSGPQPPPKGEINMSFEANESGTEPCLYGFWDLGSSSAEVFIEEIQLDVSLDPDESSWSSTIVTGAMLLNGGQEWTIELSCGAVAICCDDTNYVTVNLAE